jgi:hypothetical protein
VTLPLDLPLPQGPAPRLELFVHQGFIPFSGAEVAAQALLHRAGTLDYFRQILLRHTIDLLHYRPLSKPGLEQKLSAREYDRGHI